MESDADTAASPSDQQALEPPRAAQLYTWVEEHLPQSRGGRIALAGAVGLLVLIPSIALLLLPIWVDLSEGRFATLGYGGVFVANLASTATVFIPVPGLTAAGQTLINDQGAAQNDVLRVILFGLAGGTGMALGEVTAYAAGAVGSEVARETEFKAPRLVRPAVERVIQWIDWLMDHFAFVTLTVLSAIPNPAFELAGITAGAVRMNFWHFMGAVLIGKNARGLLLAFLGYYGLDLLFFT